MLMWQASEWICVRHDCVCGRHRRCTNAMGSNAIHEGGGRLECNDRKIGFSHGMYNCKCKLVAANSGHRRCVTLSVVGCANNGNRKIM